MAEVIEEVRPTTRRSRYVSPTASVIYILFGLLEILLGFRFFFLLLGANPLSGFVRFIYDFSEPFVAPFYGIFGQVSATRGAVVPATFDPNTIVAMVVYAIVAWALVGLFSLRR